MTDYKDLYRDLVQQMSTALDVPLGDEPPEVVNQLLVRAAVPPEHDMTSAPRQTEKGEKNLLRDLSRVLNYHHREEASGTPDFILADFLIEVLDAFDEVHNTVRFLPSFTKSWMELSELFQHKREEVASRETMMHIAIAKAYRRLEGRREQFHRNPGV